MISEPVSRRPDDTGWKQSDLGQLRAPSKHRMKPRRSLLRDRDKGARVTNIELFFDLVFVFAVTQLSHTLLGDLSALGALHVLILFLAVWWVWISTSWVTNWLQPEHWPVRIALIVLMLLGLVLSTSLPQAFGSKGLAFASAYVAMQVGRSLFMLWALQGGGGEAHARNFQRITAWVCLSGVVWIAGGFAAGDARLALWIVALSLDSVAPALGFHVPGLGRSSSTDWDVEGGHLAERCSLFIIIVLGEALVVSGATVSNLNVTPPHLAAFLIAFVGSVAFWWIYFDTGAETGSRRIADADDPGRHGRLLYTYIHLLIVAGIIVSAVGDALLLAHPEEIPDGHHLLATVGGAGLFLVGNTLFKGFARGWPPLSHLVGLFLLLCILAVGSARSSDLVVVNGLTNAVLCLVAGWEAWSLRLRGTPTHG